VWPDSNRATSSNDEGTHIDMETWTADWGGGGRNTREWEADNCNNFLLCLSKPIRLWWGPDWFW